MNKFVLFACLALVLGWASARPDVSLGYRYQQGLSGSSGSGFLNAPSTSTSYQQQPSGIASTTYYAGSAGSGVGSGAGSGCCGGSIGSIGSGSGSFGSGSFGSGSTIASDSIGLSGLQTGPTINYSEQEAYLNHLQNYQPAQVTKEFYIHSAPEDHDEQQIVRYVNVGRPQKNYRVVFINAPSSTASKAKIIANIAPVEDKTAIYVLSKKSNALDVSAEVVTQAPVKNKPEVFFIKYKTPQEAAHAQQTIQSQYDALGGTSQVSDEGLIPVSSVIGSLGDNGASGVINDGVGGVNIVGTGGVPSVDNGASNLQIFSGSGSGAVSGSSSSLAGANYVADGSSNIGVGQSSINVVRTGNILPTYLPAAQK